MPSRVPDAAAGLSGVPCATPQPQPWLTPTGRYWVAAPPGLSAGRGARVLHRPHVSVDVTPAFAMGGERVDVLAMVANEHPLPLTGLWLGLVLPPAVEVGDVVAPAGTAALVDPSAEQVVVRCPLADLQPAECVGLELELLAPVVSGRFVLTAFVTVDVDPAVTVTATRVLPVL